MSGYARRLLLALAWIATARVAAAQPLPDGPIRAFDGRVVVGGEVTATAGTLDRDAYFNYTDYEHNALRMMRFGVSGVYRPAAWLALVGEVRSEDFNHPRPYAAYARVRPWRDRAFDVEIGRIPPAFGAFGRRPYGTDNPVVGYPLAYQYLTSLRTDAIPATADDLLRMRARGWRASYPIGSQTPAPGIPLVSGFRWDTGVQARWTTGPVELSGAVTNGTLSNPRLGDDNGGKQVSGRMALTPAVGFVVGVSAARGAWLSRTVTPSSGAAPTQRALGADVEYSRDHWIVRAEAIWSRWSFPTALGPSNTDSVGAIASWAEGRYRVTPRIFVAGRVDRLGFSTLQGTAAGGPRSWDAPVRRIEGAVGYYLERHVVLRGTVQRNWRDGGRVTDHTYVSAQLTYWF
ncbi:MAG: hypothetical protein ABI818_06375 [Acidobacteriota bacterium]